MMFSVFLKIVLTVFKNRNEIGTNTEKMCTNAFNVWPYV